MSRTILRKKNQMTLPAQAVKQLGIREGELIEVEVQNDAIVLKAYVRADDEWLTDEVLAEIDEAANGPYTTVAPEDVKAFLRG